MKKYWLTIASFLMILTGLLRGLGGLALLTEGNSLDLGLPLVATPEQMKMAAYSLLGVCLLLVLSGVSLTIRRIRMNWTLSWISVILFLTGGILNGILLFGHPQASGQLVNFGISAVIAIGLILGKDSLRKTSK